MLEQINFDNNNYENKLFYTNNNDQKDKEQMQQSKYINYLLIENKSVNKFFFL